MKKLIFSLLFLGLALPLVAQQRFSWQYQPLLNARSVMLTNSANLTNLLSYVCSGGTNYAVGTTIATLWTNYNGYQCSATNPLLRTYNLLNDIWWGAPSTELTNLTLVFKMQPGANANSAITIRMNPIVKDPVSGEIFEMPDSTFAGYTKVISWAAASTHTTIITNVLVNTYNGIGNGLRIQSIANADTDTDGTVNLLEVGAGYWRRD